MIQAASLAFCNKSDVDSGLGDERRGNSSGHLCEGKKCLHAEKKSLKTDDGACECEGWGTQAPG